MLIGCACISIKDQNFGFQFDALQKSGSEKTFWEKRNAVKENPELDQTINPHYSGDVLIGWKLDRHGRLLMHLVDLIFLLREYFKLLVDCFNRLNSSKFNMKIKI